MFNVLEMLFSFILSIDGLWFFYARSHKGSLDITYKNSLEKMKLDFLNFQSCLHPCLEIYIACIHNWKY